MRFLGHLLLFGFVLNQLGCYDRTDAPRARGAHDLGCSEAEASVKEIGGKAYEVSCNGEKATYVCEMRDSGDICVRDDK